MRWLLLVVAVGFGAGLAYPYLIQVSGGLHHSVLVVHVLTAAVALVLGPLQFMRKRRVHRTVGRVYLLGGVLPSALAAIPVAIWSGHPLTQVGLTTAAVLWLVTGGLAYRAARRRDFAAHRAWMMRNYALTFLAVTARVLVPLLLLAQIPFGGAGAGSIGERAPAMIPVGQTLGWIVNLAVAEVLLRRAWRARSTTRGGAGPAA
ncbi:DUF2306 domain-containing protein [Dactylosporangium sp. CA-139066]|uniref:DUF2306 domain-containing protein n=1 Tax=Dactylosporangium sp. CA-139066 TaxID=3239930 RepID=UPI003D8C3EF7